MTILPSIPSPSTKRSTLVTVVAWMAVAYSALVTLGALLGLLALVAVPTAVNSQVTKLTADTAFTHLLPAPYLFMLHHVRLVAVIKFVWWGAVLVTAFGVLQRKEWARRAFVLVLGVEIALLIASLVLSESMGMTLASRLASRSRTGEVPPGMGSGLALGGLFVAAVIAILLWLLFAFRSVRVRAEFTSGRAA